MRQVREEPERDLVYIDDVAIDGWLENAQCASCGAILVYHERYDGIFCPQCNAWISNRCSDPDCSYCPYMPDRPVVS